MSVPSKAFLLDENSPYWDGWQMSICSATLVALRREFPSKSVPLIGVLLCSWPIKTSSVLTKIRVSITVEHSSQQIDTTYCEIVCGYFAGMWVGDCFIYNNSSWRLNYCVGGEVTVMYHLDRPMYLLGYLAKEAKVFLIDKSFGVARYPLDLAVIEYKTLVIREDESAAEEALQRIPKVSKM